MKVGLVCPYSLSWPGGVQTHVLALAPRLQEAGIDVRIVAPCDAAPPVPELIGTGPSIPVPANGSIARLAFGPSSVMAVRRILREERFDVLHIHEPFQAGASLLALSMAHGTPVVGTFHAAADELAWYRLLSPVLRAIASRITVRAAVSGAARALAEKYFGGEYVILPNGIEPAEFAGVDPYPRAAGEFVLLFVGRLEPRKGCEILLEAWPRIRSEVPGATLWIAGDGPEGDLLRERARSAGLESVDFLGRVSRDELAGRYRTADAFCAPSLGGESFGIVLLEAMAAGTPVVASDLPGYAEVVEDGRDGLLFERSDPEALAARVCELARDDGLRVQLASRGPARAAEFAWEALVPRVIEQYEAAVGTTRHPRGKEAA